MSARIIFVTRVERFEIGCFRDDKIVLDETVEGRVTVSKDGGGPPLPKAFIERVPKEG